MAGTNYKTLQFTETSSLVEVMRDESRSTLIEGRKYNRSLVFKEKRPIRDETTDKQRLWSCHEVAEKAKELKDQTLSMTDYIMLQKSLLKDEDTVNCFLRVDNILEAITRDLTCGNPAIQLIAASCSCNAALASCEVCDLLAKTTGPYLIANLHALNYPLSEICAWTIGNLSAGSKLAFEVLCAQGCMKRLISLINDCDDTCKSSIAYAIKHCLHAGHEIITDSEVKDLTLALISRKDFLDNNEFLWILALLSSREASHEQLLFTIESIFQLVWKAMIDRKAENVNLITPVIRIFGNVVCEPTGKAADIFLDISKTNDIGSFFEYLLSCPQDYVQKECLWFLGNLYGHAQPRICARVRVDLICVLNSLKRFVR